MKKLTLILALAGFSFFASSCSKEDIKPTKAVAEAAPCDRDTVGTCQIPPP